MAVFGDRFWVRTPRGSHVTVPQPFAEMALRYDNSFGGAGYPKNPIGKGHVPADSAETAYALPNIVGADRWANSPMRPEPAGFGPLQRIWEYRFSKLGTYDEQWLKRRWPWFPEDLDWGHFNAAPPDMQVDGYLQGDEELEFVNLHAAHQRYRSRLPALRLRCFVDEVRDTVTGGAGFHEVAMNLDTLWVDMEAEQCVLVWRGVTRVATEDHQELRHVFIASESLSDPPQTTEHYRELFTQRLLALEEEEAESLDAEEPASPEEESPSSLDEELTALEEERRAALLAAGLDPDEELPPPSEESKAAEAQLLAELGIVDEEEPAPLTLQQVQDRIDRGESFADEDLSGTDLTKLIAAGVNFEGAMMADVCLKGADLSGARLSGANLANADLSGAGLAGAMLREADLTAANLTKADLTRAVLDEAIVDKARLARAVLDEVSASATSFVEADLKEATARAAVFRGADFSRAVLDDADLSGCNLREASIETATARRVNFAGADLTELRASEGTDFSGSSFRRVNGAESIWEHWVLHEADFSFAHLDGADFTAASLERANFHAASLKGARFLRGNLTEARLTSVNLFEGMLEKADLTRVDFSGASVYGAEFLDAICDGIRLDFANVKMTKLQSR